MGFYYESEEPVEEITVRQPQVTPVETPPEVTIEPTEIMNTNIAINEQAEPTITTQEII
jgi:hypothetical protein